MYQYYSSLERYYAPSEFYHYVKDDYNAQYCKQLAEKIVNTATKNGMSEREAVFEVVSFVQGITYASDVDSTGKLIEYPKYPIETLMDKKGDCEDVAILLATMLRELGYGVALIHYEGHIMLGLWGTENEDGYYFNVDGKRYYVLETTAYGWDMGNLPTEYENQKAYVYVMP